MGYFFPTEAHWINHRRKLLSSAKTKGSNCSLEKWAVTTYWLCRTVPAQRIALSDIAAGAPFLTVVNVYCRYSRSDWSRSFIRLVIDRDDHHSIATSTIYNPKYEWMNEWMKSYIAHVSSRRLFRALYIESNLARPVIIQIPTQSPGRYTAELPLRRIKLFSFQANSPYVPSTHTLWIFWGLAGWKLRLRPLRFFYVQL